MSTLRLLVGKSGSGKDYLVRKLGLKPVVSYTTREIRPGEVNGREHRFVDITEYKYQLFRNRVFIAYTYYNNHHYWATEEDLYGKNVYIIDLDGVKMFQDTVKGYGLHVNYTILYLNIGLIKRIRNRLKRGDTWKSIVSRVWGDFWAFRGIKKLMDYEIKY